MLPFDSLGGPRDDNAMFADGIHDDLLTRLASIKSLKVISRTSVMEYRGTSKNAREIAGELDARKSGGGGDERRFLVVARTGRGDLKIEL